MYTHARARRFGRSFTTAVSVALITTLPGCTTATSAKVMTQNQTQPIMSVPIMSVTEARDIVQKIAPKRNLWLKQKHRIASVVVSATEITLFTDKDEICHFALKDIPQNEHATRIVLNEHHQIYDSSTESERNVQNMHQLADALNVLRSAAEDQPSPERDEVAFQESVRKYRAAVDKPVMPETARRFKVQAEAAIQDKAFGDAASDFYQALEIVPWWAGGYFNNALVLGELGDYPEAIKEMQRYLALAPDASDARSAQDQIYKWQAKTVLGQCPEKR